jgi:hypothetical protein
MSVESLSENRMAAVAARVRRSASWVIKPYCKEDEAEVLRLHQDVFNSSIEAEEWRWKYFKNPVGAPLMLVAREIDTGQVIGFHAAIPVVKRIAGEFELFYLIVDTAIAPAYRHKGLYIDLGHRIHNLRRGDKSLLMMGLPNDKALPVVLKLGGIKLGALEAYFRVLNWRHVLRGRLKFSIAESMLGRVGNIYASMLTRKFRANFLGSDVQEIVSFEEDIEKLCVAALSDYAVHTLRTKAYMNWRYFENPCRCYKVFEYRHAKRLGGYIAVTTTHKGGLKIGVIVDLVFDSQIAIGRALLQRAMGSFLEQKVDVVVSLLSLSESYNALFRSKGFWHTALTWTKRPFYVVLDLGLSQNVNPEKIKKYDSMLRTPGAWFLSLGDTDLV